ncbi:MAG: thiamine phosphate synthase [Myxococcota bacterium]
MSELYPIVDLDALARRGIDPIAFSERVLAARPPRLQLRAKHASARTTLELLRALVPLCAQAGTQLFANDRPDLAVLAGSAGVHVGQHDLDVASVRRFAPNLLVGVSTHDFVQLEAALQDRPAYVAFGPVFQTESKLNPDPVVGLDGLRRARAMAGAAGVPLVAIGGIDAARARELAELDISVAVISALLAPSLDEVEQCTRALMQTLAKS